jgi:hypothetical protein
MKTSKMTWMGHLKIKKMDGSIVYPSFIFYLILRAFRISVCFDLNQNPILKRVLLFIFILFFKKKLNQSGVRSHVTFLC